MDDHPPHSPETFEALSARRYSRRSVLQGGLAGLFLAALPAPLRAEELKTTSVLSSFRFTEISKADTPDLQLARGYRADVLLRWGDGLFADSPAFDPKRPDPKKQSRQFGYNNDFLAFMPLPEGSGNSDHGLLCVNHEYTNILAMYPALAVGQYVGRLSAEHVKGLQAAQGLSIVEVERKEGAWQIATGSRFNRRVTANSPVAFSGPAAGHARLKTRYDETGFHGFGTLANCAGGTTPWGTVLTAEENFNDYFPGNPDGTPEARNYRRYGIGRSKYPQPWWRRDPRFDIAQEPNEPNRFGWIVEYDPYDPEAVPVKRTALGRFKHECASTALSHDGRVASYSGDDEKFEYLYRYVSRKPYQGGMAKAEAGTLLDDGILYAAKFYDDGRMEWLPLVYGEGALTPENDFHSQADVLIETRRAADLMGATPMDRPEDVEAHPVTGKIYVSLTKNAAREASQTDAVNPRAKNIHGHIIELLPPLEDNKPDHGARFYRWDMFLRGGDPRKAGDDAMYLSTPSENGFLSCPDNLALDPKGRLWICTDGQPDSIGKCNSLYAADLKGPARGQPRLFLNGPHGAEITGPAFTPDGRTLFLSIQHPGEDSRLGEPTTRWPDFDADLPPRPSVIAITKEDGGMIGD